MFGSISAGYGAAFSAGSGIKTLSPVLQKGGNEGEDLRVEVSACYA
jgi:hypothetical protein